MNNGFPAARPRRLRRTAALRRLAARTTVRGSDLVLPLFVKEGISEPEPVPSMPGVAQHTRDSLRKVAAEAVEAGVGGLMLFGIPAVKDARGSAADDPDGIVQQALADLAGEVGDATVLMADLCLCEYTDHGHCGIINTRYDDLPIPTIVGNPPTQVYYPQVPEGDVLNDPKQNPLIWSKHQ